MEVIFKVGQVRQMMAKCQHNAVLRGDTTYAVPVERFLGFDAFDVTEMHNYRGSEFGLWFRLNDGRVIDWQGRECERERAFYDQAVH